MKEANKIKFDCNGNNAPAYSFDKPGDNSGTYVQYTDYDELLRERNELAAQVERLRCAWEAVKSTDWDFPMEEVLSETPAQSLEAVKREWLAEFVELARRNAEYGPGDSLAIGIDELYEIAGL